MDDRPKTVDYEALVEMANTPGWKIIEDMLMWDIKFSSGLLNTPRPPKKIGVDKNNNPIMSEAEWVKDEHGVGYARGIYSTASKYANKIKNAREHLNKSLKGE
jgi:hypothetical protein